MSNDSALKSPIQLSFNFLLVLNSALPLNTVLYNVDIEGGAGYQEETGVDEE